MAQPSEGTLFVWGLAVLGLTLCICVATMASCEKTRYDLNSKAGKYSSGYLEPQEPTQ